ncbi:MAG: cell wall-active antibiotics response protein [Acidobacteriia bacterium]|nr:cell wall-active antibiotics response protein [Terriglobia bacterium]
MTNGAQTGPGWETSGRFIPALILIVVGAIFLLTNLHVFPPDWNWGTLWPVILIVLGLYKMVDGGGRRTSTRGGAILLAIGAVFLLDNFGILPVPVWELWPLLLIALGFGLLLDRIPWHERLGALRPRPPAPGKVKLDAVFSGGKRKYDGEDFQGGTISAVFGGFELDLRRAVMTVDSAVLQVDAVFGGCEIKIPETWNVTLHGGAVFGGYSDESHHPAPGAPGSKQLIIKGGAVFGGVVVKN